MAFRLSSVNAGWLDRNQRAVVFDASDPRAALGATSPAQTRSHAPKPAQLFEIESSEPDETHGSRTRTWWVRSQNLVVGYSRAALGATLVRRDQPDEYVALFPSRDTRVSIVAGAEMATVAGEAVAVIPAGDSEIAVMADCDVVRLFSHTAEDLGNRCRNAEEYARADLNVAPFRSWLAPSAGAAIRIYRPSAAPRDPARFGRIYRCSTLMVNYLEREDRPRSDDRLSPHHHDDFEQVTIQLAGDYMHHLRTPWGTRLADWREDEHLRTSSPAILVIPPPLIHTSQAVGVGSHQLADVFCPPRKDFSEMPGWILNSRDYPLPASGGTDQAPTR
jgi:hypothetical protein